MVCLGLNLSHLALSSLSTVGDLLDLEYLLSLLPLYLPLDLLAVVEVLLEPDELVELRRLFLDLLCLLGELEELDELLLRDLEDPEELEYFFFFLSLWRLPRDLHR